VADERVRTFLLRLAVLDNSTLMPLLLFFVCGAEGRAVGSAALRDPRGHRVVLWSGAGSAASRRRTTIVSSLDSSMKSARRRHSTQATFAATSGRVRGQPVAVGSRCRARLVARAAVPAPRFRRHPDAAGSRAGRASHVQAGESPRAAASDGRTRLTPRWRESWAAPAPT